MNKELISTAVSRRLNEVRERVNRFDPETFGDAGFFLTSIKELLLDHPTRVSSLTPFSSPAEWVAADTECLTSLRVLALHGTKTMPRAQHPSLDNFWDQLRVRTGSPEAAFDPLVERYAWPLNFSFPPEDAIREYVLMRLMTADRARIESNSAGAVNPDDLLLKLNLISVHAATATDLRFLDALNYYYELLPVNWRPESQHGWLLISWFALYARALNSWS
ncbi:MAG TPA: hypothetical protein VFX97_13375 [Pyrinomonadaceae bacterium]|nr:hypothetical protein [Pyrinomonadaceae bacterium]